MKREFNLRLEVEYSVEAEDEDDAKVQLEERFAIENQTAENEFWDNMEVKEVKE